MPIKIKTDLEFGQSWYIKNDPDQFEHSLVGVTFLPGNQVKFTLSYMGDVCTVYDFECSREPDPSKIKPDDEAD